jgi:hypothetical protein
VEATVTDLLLVICPRVRRRSKVQLFGGGMALNGSRQVEEQVSIAATPTDQRVKF